MNRLQYFTTFDKLRYFKLSKSKSNNLCFFEQPNINKKISINSGMNNNNFYKEKIITDGIIMPLAEYNCKPTIIWKNELIKLNDGMCVSVSIQKASFYINVISKNNKTEYDIHVEKEDLAIYKKIINYLNGKKTDDLIINTMSLNRNKIILNKYIGGSCKETTIKLYHRAKHKQKAKRK